MRSASESPRALPVRASDYRGRVRVDDPATAYGLFTGRFSQPLAREFADVVGLTPGQRVLDVGCGPGALTQVLVERLGLPAVSAVDPSAAYVAAGAREGQLAELAREAGLVRVDSSRLTVEVSFETFGEWWEPLTLGVGSGGAYVHGLDESGREALSERLEQALGPAPFTASASAWCVRAEVAGST